jgi:hypothetical protein
MPDTIGHRALSSTDGYGKPTHVASVSYVHSRYVPNQKLVEVAGGQTIMRQGMVIFSTTIAISPDDLIVLPDATEHRVLRVVTGRGGSGAEHHTTVEFV